MLFCKLRGDILRLVFFSRREVFFGFFQRGYIYRLISFQIFCYSRELVENNFRPADDSDNFSNLFFQEKFDDLLKDGSGIEVPDCTLCEICHNAESRFHFRHALSYICKYSFDFSFADVARKGYIQPVFFYIGSHFRHPVILHSTLFCMLRITAMIRQVYAAAGPESNLRHRPICPPSSPSPGSL